MQLALVDNERREAFPQGHGTCPTCGAGMVAKCGPRVIHHWAHAGRRNCDPWWENETAWHREWKNLFPEECREVIHTAPMEKFIDDRRTCIASLENINAELRDRPGL